MAGWISIHRKIQDHWLWEDKPYSKGQAWIDLLMMANHKDNKFLLGAELEEVERGSFITSDYKLMEKWGWSKTKVRTFLKLLEDEKMLVRKSDQKKTTLTIVNYNDYQTLETTEKLPKDYEKTTERLLKNPNNNDNNDNNLLFMYDENLKEIVKLLQENIGVIPPILIDLVGEYADTFDSKMFAEAVIIATNKKVRSVKYVLGILKQWKDSNILTFEDLETFRREKELEKEKKPNNNPNGSKYNSYSKKAAPKKTRFHNFESRTDKYDNKELEKMADKKRKAKKPDSSSGLAFLDQFKETEE